MVNIIKQEVVIEESAEDFFTDKENKENDDGFEL